MKHCISVSTVAILLAGCGSPAGSPVPLNDGAADSPRERAAVVYQADQGGQCSAFRVVGVDGAASGANRGAFEVAPGRHELIFRKQDDTAAVPAEEADPFLLELLYMTPARTVCKVVSVDMCLRFDATLEPGGSYRLRALDEETYRLVDWRSDRPVARGEIVARAQPGRPLDCGPYVAAGGAPGPALYSPVIAAPGSVPGAPATGGPARIVPAGAPAQPVPARPLPPTDGPRQLLPAATPAEPVPASPAPAGDGPRRLFPAAAQQELLTW